VPEYDRRHEHQDETTEAGNVGSTPDDRAALDEVYVAQRTLWAAVGRARDLGFTWEEIGGRLGFSAQTVHQRFAHAMSTGEPPDSDSTS
jgi:hypothetical protein